MAFTLTVGGLDVIAANYLHLAAGAVSLDATLQSRGLLRFTLKDRTGVYRPALHAEVIAELDGVRVFGGNLTTVDEQDWGDYRGIWCLCEAADFGAILDTMLFNGVLPGITLRELVQDMVDQLIGAEGFTVHRGDGRRPGHRARSARGSPTCATSSTTSARWRSGRGPSRPTRRSCSRSRGWRPGPSTSPRPTTRSTP